MTEPVTARADGADGVTSDDVAVLVEDDGGRAMGPGPADTGGADRAVLAAIADRRVAGEKLSEADVPARWRAAVAAISAVDRRASAWRGLP